jgi:hypothetical protein
VELAVRQAQGVDRLLALRDLAGREIDADAARLRVGGGDRDQVAAGGAAQFEDRRGRQGRGREAEQAGDGGEALGVRLAERVALVRHAVVGGLVGPLGRVERRAGLVGRFGRHGASSGGREENGFLPE